MRQRRLGQPCANPDDPGCRCDACRYVEEMDLKGELPVPVPVNLRVYKQQPSEPVIRRLKQLLEQAESGDLRWFFCVGELIDGTVTVRAGNVTDASRVIGKMHFGLQRLTRELMDYDKDE